MQRESCCTELDNLLRLYLRHLYTNSELLEVSTELSPNGPLLRATFLTYKKADMTSLHAVEWSMAEWNLETAGMYGLLRFILEYVLWWLDARLTRFERLKHVNIFNAEMHDSDSPTAGVIAKKEKLEWHAIILKFGGEHASVND